MQLNLPILDQLAGCRNILIAGMGGGFDIFCGLPIYFALRERGLRAHLANLTFSATDGLDGPARLSPTLVGVSADAPGLVPPDIERALQEPFAAATVAQAGYALYFPERHLARWFRERRGEEITIWCFDKTGVRPLIENYRRLVERLGIDGMLLIDGGVDSLMRGDEASAGTFVEDAISLAAASALEDVPVRLLACLGLGAEQDISYAHALEDIATLAAEGAFLGACALARQMPAYQAYEDAVLYAQQMPLQEPSVINSSIVSAVRGHYGDYHLTAKTRGSRLWISPLMALYWFFDLPAVARRSRLIGPALPSETFNQALRALTLARRQIAARPQKRIPLP